MPMTPFIGVRISWLMMARNSLFARSAPSASFLGLLQFLVALQQLAFLPAQHFHLELHEVDHRDHPHVFSGYGGDDDIVEAPVHRPHFEHVLDFEEGPFGINDNSAVHRDDEGKQDVGCAAARAEQHTGDLRFLQHLPGEKGVPVPGTQRGRKPF